MANGTTYYTGPKRNVRRVRRQIEVDFANSEVNTGLYTSTEKETLVRTVIELDFLQNHSGNAVNMAAELKIQRGGQSFDEAVDEGNLSAVEPPNESLWLHQTGFKIVGSGQNSRQTHVSADLKSMRKMSDGDALDLVCVGSYPSDSGTVTGVMTFFFKEK